MKEIIIADDSSLARMFTARCLATAGYSGYTVTEAKDGQEVYALLSEKRYDLVITDLNMPEMDGLELVKRISKVPSLATTPILVITSAGNEEQRSELLTLGVLAVISKPIFHSDLVKAIGDILELEGSDYA